MHHVQQMYLLYMVHNSNFLHTSTCLLQQTKQLSKLQFQSHNTCICIINVYTYIDNQFVLFCPSMTTQSLVVPSIVLLTHIWVNMIISILSAQFRHYWFLIRWFLIWTEANVLLLIAVHCSIALILLLITWQPALTLYMLDYFNLLIPER